MKRSLLGSLFILLLLSCQDDEIKPEQPIVNSNYAVSGRVAHSFGLGLEGVQISWGSSDTLLTDPLGNWSLANLKGEFTLRPQAANYTFTPAFYLVNGSKQNIVFQANRVYSLKEQQIFNWFDSQQLGNGLLESVENGNVVSLYDNALAAMVFMLRGDFVRAEKVFDFFQGRMNTELLSGSGGFYQFRNQFGLPSGNRWMGDNAWLLIALNNYKALTGRSKYNQMASELASWLQALQDSDGGLFAGYAANDSLLNYKVTEGNIDAFNAIAGYTPFHRNLLSFLERERWDPLNKDLLSWPGNPAYLYALDCHSWSYCLFDQFPQSTLISASRFINTQTATINQAQVTGFDIDEDKDALFMEGTGQMALAFRIAGMTAQSEYYLSEMEKILVPSTGHVNAAGIPYSSNRGTAYGSDPIWLGADTKIALSAGAWYLFARLGFNPFAVGRSKNMPVADMFWLN